MATQSEASGVISTSAAMQITERLANQLAERSATNIVNPLGTLDDCLATRLSLLESAVERQVADVGQRLNDGLSSVESRIRLPVHHGPPLKLPTFDGQSSLQAFIIQFETVADFYGFDSTSRARAMVAQLRGNAAECLESMSATSRSSYQLLIEALKSRFGDEHLQQFHLTALKHHRQGTDTLQELADVIQRMARRALVGCTEVDLEQIATTAFIDAIEDTDIQLLVRLAHPTTTRAALARALEVQAANKAMDMVSTSGIKLSRVAHRSSPVRSSKRRCFTCGDIGHLARSCPNHLAPCKMQPIPTPNVSSDSEPGKVESHVVHHVPLVTTPVRTSPTPCLSVHLHELGQHVNAIVDTGAAVSLIDYALLQSAKCTTPKRLPGTVCLISADGSTIEQEGQISLTVETLGTTVNLPFVNIVCQPYQLSPLAISPVVLRQSCPKEIAGEAKKQFPGILRTYSMDLS
ncbi:uncharacterized protein LOC121045728 [Ixodes scapularis]|uniref:uncharacterized protein LOC121045728 n=1 Tax=Ixodes scapularis TaxID=6945 RepID=UPI001C3832F3|nr:uncharacterized protein LOC121045728 [Ixodes scapularis]